MAEAERTFGSVMGIYAVIQGNVQNGAVLGVALGRACAVAGGIIVAGAGYLLTADEGVVPGIPEGEAQLPHYAGNDNIVILIKGQAAHHAVHGEGAFPETVRGVFMYA